MSQLSRLLDRGVNLNNWLTEQGRVFIASDADQNDTVLGQTSFANTTPTFMIDVAANYAVIPISVSLNQTGASVAGGAIDVIIEMDSAVRYSSGGTSELKYNANTASTNTSNSLVYSNPTASAGYGVRVWGVTVGPDISTTEGVSNEVLWTPDTLHIIKGASTKGSFLVYTYAPTTAPTWFWTIKYAEIPTSWLT